MHPGRYAALALVAGSLAAGCAIGVLVERNPAAQSLLVTGERDAPEFRRLKAALRTLPPPADGRQ
ncbi:MAG: hypothetical protein HY705_07795 [Gemmatimonadetes bacterium]|nr:hypothetical protein [Gemmatimonadota bacterium]